MSRENRLWGAPRIHGELLKLGFKVAESTVSTYMIRHRGPPSQSWRTFLSKAPQQPLPKGPGNIYLPFALCGGGKEYVALPQGERAMRIVSFLTAGLGVAVSIAVLAVGLKISTPAWSAAEPPQHTINRTLKGDRSPLIPQGLITRPREALFSKELFVAPVLLEGCEPVVSAIGEPLLAQVARSCQS